MKTVMRVIVKNGISTVIENPNSFSQPMGEFYKHINEANKIMDQINTQNEYNRQILDKANNIINNVPQSTAPNIIQDNSWWQEFLERGKYSNNNPQSDGLTQKFLDPDYWANFSVDIIKKTLILLWQGFMGFSHWLCILIAVAGILAYIAGYKKGGVISICSVIFYILLRLINMLIMGV